MRIFHGPKNPGGMAGILARAQRQLGHEATSASYRSTGFNYACDYSLRSSTMYSKMAEWACYVAGNAPQFHVFHFYFGESLCGPGLWDVPWLKRIGKRVFFYFCGCDIRDCKHVINTYKHSACAVCWPMLCSRNRIKARKIALEYADGIFVSTPDLLEFLPGAKLLPQPIDLEHFASLSQNQGASAPPGQPGVDRPVRIAHAPSNRTIKGTDTIIAAVERLQRRGLKVQLVLVENQSHAGAIAACNRCDLAVDQLLVGTYGQYAVEMMALGKPTFCHIRQDVLPLYPQSCPVIRASTDDFEEVLVEWVRHPEWWSAAGESGRRYVKQVHDMYSVAKVCLKAYQGNL